jgi:hypothetical protein
LLSCEFLARAACEDPRALRSVGLVSPTGLRRRARSGVPDGADAGRPLVRAALAAPLWSRALFAALTSRPGLRLSLGRAWGWRAVDEALLAYAYETSHQPGAERAPWAAASGFLSSRDAERVYRGLELPVWVAHGARGALARALLPSRFRGHPDWTVASFPTGALPQFESLDEVVRSYDAFVAAVENGARTLGERRPSGRSQAG